MVFGTPVTQVFGIELVPVPEPEDADQRSGPTIDDVANILGDYARLRDKEDRAREVKAADMRRYRSNVRARRTPTP